MDTKAQHPTEYVHMQLIQSSLCEYENAITIVLKQYPILGCTKNWSDRDKWIKQHNWDICMAGSTNIRNV